MGELHEMNTALTSSHLNVNLPTVPNQRVDNRLDSCQSPDQFFVSMVNEFLNDDTVDEATKTSPLDIQCLNEPESAGVESLINFHHIKELDNATNALSSSPSSSSTNQHGVLEMKESTQEMNCLLYSINDNLPTNAKEISYQRFGRFNANLPAEVHNFKCHLCSFSSKHDKSEQTDITPDDFELDDCLLESNDIVITQNKDGFILHVKKLGNITTAKLTSQDEDQVAAAAVAAATGGHIQQGQAQITEIQEVQDVKPTFTTLTTSPSIKLPSSECELINLKKIIPASTTISTHHPHATIIQTQQIQPVQIQQHQQQHQHQQPQQLQEIVHHHQQQQHQQQQQHHHQQPQHHQHQQQQQHHQLQHHPQVQSIVTTTPTAQGGTHSQTINLMGLRNVQIAEQKPVVSRIKYSRGKIITTQTTGAGNVQILQTQDAQTHEITDGTKYEISEIDLNNPQTSAAIISDLVKYAEIDDIELPDGTKIGIGFAPTEITEHMQTSGTTAQITTIDDSTQQHHQLQQQTSQHHQLQAQVHHIQTTPTHQQQQHHIIQQQQTAHVVHHQELHLQDQDDNTTSVEAILPDGLSVQHDQPTITKSYTILTARPLKTESTHDLSELTQPSATTYELSLSDSSLGPNDERGDESKYVCRHCGKKYRWKSTLRRHENVECGGKEPCHPCPYCSYKAKQRGNLGVHVRKHHPDKPELESKRGRKI